MAKRVIETADENEAVPKAARVDLVYSLKPSSPAWVFLDSADSSRVSPYRPGTRTVYAWARHESLRAAGIFYAGILREGFISKVDNTAKVIDCIPTEDGFYGTLITCGEVQATGYFDFDLKPIAGRYLDIRTKTGRRAGLFNERQQLVEGICEVFGKWRWTGTFNDVNGYIKLNGFGTAINLRTGSCFRGLFSNGEKVTGKMTCKNGITVEGSRINNGSHGYTEVTLPGGPTFTTVANGGRIKAEITITEEGQLKLLKTLE